MEADQKTIMGSFSNSHMDRFSIRPCCITAVVPSFKFPELGHSSVCVCLPECTCDREKEKTGHREEGR